MDATRPNDVERASHFRSNSQDGNTARRKSMTYPDGRVINIGYGSANSADDLISRIASLKINGEGTNLADYTYFGLTDLAKASVVRLTVCYLIIIV